MTRMNLFVLCLSVLATVQLTSGQGDWDQGWHQGGWNQRSWGHNRQRASRAICAATVGNPDACDPQSTTIEITIKRSSSGWWRSNLELEIKAATDDALNRREFDLVLTRFGADDNEGGCTVENLGNIVKRRNRGSWFGWGSWTASAFSDGVIGEVDLTSGRFEGTFRNLPISSVEEAYGCGVALCRGTEDVEDGSSSWHSGWWRSTESEMRCEEPIPICCHLGKSEDDADSPDID